MSSNTAATTVEDIGRLFISEWANGQYGLEDLSQTHTQNFCIKTRCTTLGKRD